MTCKRIVKTFGLRQHGPLYEPTCPNGPLPIVHRSSLKSEDPIRAAPWACRRVLWWLLEIEIVLRHLYRSAANCEMHPRRTGGYEPKALAVPVMTMMGSISCRARVSLKSRRWSSGSSTSHLPERVPQHFVSALWSRRRRKRYCANAGEVLVAHRKRSGQPKSTQATGSIATYEGACG